MKKNTNHSTVYIYQDKKGNEPFFDWLNGLKDGEGQKRILTRLRRLEQGNFGDHASVGDGVFELRLFFGTGYRIYFGQEGNAEVIRLSGGDKNSQNRDLKWPKPNGMNIKTMRNMRTLDHIEEEYLSGHPEELETIFKLSLKNMPRIMT